VLQRRALVSRATRSLGVRPREKKKERERARGFISSAH